MLLSDLRELCGRGDVTPERLVGRRVELVTIGSFSVPGPRGGDGDGEERGGSCGGGVVDSV